MQDAYTHIYSKLDSYPSKSCKNNLFKGSQFYLTRDQNCTISKKKKILACIESKNIFKKKSFDKF